ncbi:UvrD-helicase domain-containing protein [Pseudomonas shirazensis]|uniref:UvrD-helicase domain-containing protein n=1 Tax=Pseudomonas shirazensis TaxID=2745494 RepID=UPI003986C312
MPAEIDLFSFPRGSVTAPAGCGKTQLIADTLTAHVDAKPILLLTHTNAGVAALRTRLQRAQILASKYQVATLDGFAMRLISKFPARSGHDPAILLLENRAHDYPAIRNAAGLLLQSGHINAVIRASYSHLLVDEYQDCNQSQHVIVAWLAQNVPTYVLGDPMQAIFGFRGNPLVNWQADVFPHFPAVGTLDTPWRWRRANTERLGRWLLELRRPLAVGEGIDLRTAPQEVEWVAIRPETADAQRRNAALVRIRDGESALIIGDSTNPASRFRLSSQTPGATAVENVELSELISFARSFDPTSDQALNELVNLAASVMTGVGAAALLGRVKIIVGGRNRTEPTAIEQSAVDFHQSPGFAAAARLIESFGAQPGTHVYRPEVFRACLSALRMAAAGTHSLRDAALQVRERNRLVGRPLSRRAVGSTLLLKGLESDIAVILNPSQMDANNLYVAMTRGAKKLVICSETPILVPRM